MGEFLAGRLNTVGAIAAAVAAAAYRQAHAAAAWLSSMTRSTPASRARQPGRPPVPRAGGCCAWPGARGRGATGCPPLTPHHPVVLGVTTAWSGAGPGEAGLLAAWQAISAPAAAGVRLLGLDPLVVAGL